MANEYPLNVKTPVSLTYVTRNIPQVTVDQRERALRATHYNEFAFPAGMLTVDMLSDKRVSTLPKKHNKAFRVHSVLRLR